MRRALDHARYGRGALLVCYVAAILLSGCVVDYQAPAYRAYLVNQYPEPLFVTLTEGGQTKPDFYLLAADPNVAQDAGRAVLGYENSGKWVPGRVTLLRANCSVLATVDVATGEWTLVIAASGTTTSTAGPSGLTMRPLPVASSAPCPAPSPT